MLLSPLPPPTLLSLLPLRLQASAPDEVGAVGSSSVVIATTTTVTRLAAISCRRYGTVVADLTRCLEGENLSVRGIAQRTDCNAVVLHPLYAACRCDAGTNGTSCGNSDVVNDEPFAATMTVLAFEGLDYKSTEWFELDLSLRMALISLAFEGVGIDPCRGFCKSTPSRMRIEYVETQRQTSGGSLRPPSGSPSFVSAQVSVRSEGEARRLTEVTKGSAVLFRLISNVLGVAVGSLPEPTAQKYDFTFGQVDFDVAGTDLAGLVSTFRLVLESFGVEAAGSDDLALLVVRDENNRLVLQLTARTTEELFLIDRNGAAIRAATLQRWTPKTSTTTTAATAADNSKNNSDNLSGATVATVVGCAIVVLIALIILVVVCLLCPSSKRATVHSHPVIINTMTADGGVPASHPIDHHEFASPARSSEGSEYGADYRAGNQHMDEIDGQGAAEQGQHEVRSDDYTGNFLDLYTAEPHDDTVGRHDDGANGVQRRQVEEVTFM
jgi:hypothetical protein